MQGVDESIHLIRKPPEERSDRSGLVVPHPHLIEALTFARYFLALIVCFQTYQREAVIVKVYY